MSLDRLTLLVLPRVARPLLLLWAGFGIFEGVTLRALCPGNLEAHPAQKKAHELFFRYSARIQEAALALRFASLLHYSFHFFYIAGLYTGLPGYLASVALFPPILLAGLASALGYLAASRMKKPEISSEKNAITIKEGTAHAQFGTSLFQVAQIILQIALACITHQWVFFGISAAITSYALYKNNRLRWTEFSQTIPLTEIYPQLRELRISYFACTILFPSRGDECNTCSTLPNDEVFASSCLYHKSCPECMIEWTVTKLGQPRLQSITKILPPPNSRNPAEYQVVLTPASRPICPLCRNTLPQNYWRGRMVEADGAEYAAIITVATQ